MGDALEKVRSGEDLAIPAAAYNAFVDAARAEKARQGDQGIPGQAIPRESGIVLVKNTTESDLARFAVLGIDSPIFTPTEAEQEFKNRVALNGVAPDEKLHENRFAVLQEPLPAGSIGRAMIHGITPVKIDVTNVMHGWARVADGDTNKLTTCYAGQAGIVWKPTDGLGEKWAIVEIGHTPGRIRYGKVGSTGLVNKDGGLYSGANDGPFVRALRLERCDSQGNHTIAGKYIYVACPWSETGHAFRGVFAPNVWIWPTIVPFIEGDGRETMTIFGESRQLAGHVVAPHLLGAPLPMMDDALIGVAMLPWWEDRGPDSVLDYEPTGWHLCNGAAGQGKNGITVPEFRDRFLRCSQGTQLGNTGGAETHQHDAHAANGVAESGSGQSVMVSATHSAAEHLPPYITMNWIMWVGIPGYGA